MTGFRVTYKTNKGSGVVLTAAPFGHISFQLLTLDPQSEHVSDDSDNSGPIDSETTGS